MTVSQIWHGLVMGSFWRHPPTMASAGMFSQKIVFPCEWFRCQNVHRHICASTLSMAVPGDCPSDLIGCSRKQLTGQFIKFTALNSTLLCLCSIAAFAPGELGEPAPMSDVPEHVQAYLSAATRTAAPFKAQDAHPGSIVKTPLPQTSTPTVPAVAHRCTDAAMPPAAPPKQSAPGAAVGNSRVCHTAGHSCQSKAPLGQTLACIMISGPVCN